jgi:fructose-1,6-bisphosphatase I
MKDTALSTFLFHNGAPDALRHLIMDIATATKYIVHAIRTGDLGLAGTSNLYGEEQLALDVLADQIITGALIDSNLVHSLVSEEKEGLQPIYSKKEFPCQYTVVFDPLDGSSLIDANLAVGSIFGIYKTKNPIGQPGKEMVAALYALYGPRTTFVYSIGKGVHEFTLNDVGEYTLSRANIRIKEHSKTFSPGNIKSVGTNPGYQKLVNYWLKSGYKLRYSGGLVPDINLILTKGDGIFTYPACPKTLPQGKLRLLFECNPMAYLVTNAGGAAHNGQKNILNLKIETLDQKTPIFIGSKEEVKRAVEFMG